MSCEYIILFQFACSVREGLENYFPADSGVTVIAEPGRYYAESAASLVTNIIGIKNGKKIRRSTGGVSNTIVRKHSTRRPVLTRQASSTVHRRLSRNESISKFVLWFNINLTMFKSHISHKWKITMN